MPGKIGPNMRCTIPNTRNTKPKDIAKSQGVANIARLTNALKSVNRYKNGAILSIAARRFIGLDKRGKTAGTIATIQYNVATTVGNNGSSSVQNDHNGIAANSR